MSRPAQSTEPSQPSLQAGLVVPEVQKGHKRVSRSSETARLPQEPSQRLVPDLSNIRCACSPEGSGSPPTEPDRTHLPVVIGAGSERSDPRIVTRFVSPVAAGRYSLARNLQRLS